MVVRGKKKTMEFEGNQPIVNIELSNSPLAFPPPGPSSLSGGKGNHLPNTLPCAQLYTHLLIFTP